MPAYHIMREGKCLTVCIGTYGTWDEIMAAMKRISLDRVDFKARRYYCEGKHGTLEVVR